MFIYPYHIFIFTEDGCTSHWSIRIQKFYVKI